MDKKNNIEEACNIIFTKQYLKVKNRKIQKTIINIFDLLYRIGKPQIQDQEYDRLLQIYNLEPELHSDIDDFLDVVFSKEDILFILDFFNVPKENIRFQHNKKKLPFFMGSMQKKKDIQQLQSFLKKTNENKFLVSEKLDGISSLLFLDFEHARVELFTRGDGEFGKDITWLYYFINVFQNQKQTFQFILQKNKNIKQMFIRGELIIKKSPDLQQKERQIMAGLANQKSIDIGFFQKYSVDFVPYHIFQIGNIQSEFQLLKEMKFQNYPLFQIANLTQQNIQEKLQSILDSYKKQSKYQIDGLIVHTMQNYEDSRQKIPEYAFAFKQEGQQKESEVILVKWKISKNALIIPVIYIKQIEIEGIKIKKVSGYNADFIIKNKIVPGAIVLIERSNDVIPILKQVIYTPIKSQNEQDYVQQVIDMSFPKEIQYDFRGVDIVAKEESSEQLSEKIYFFAKNLKLKNLGLQTIKLILEKNKNIKSILDFIEKVDYDNLQSIKGIGQKKIEQIIKNLE